MKFAFVTILVDHLFIYLFFLSPVDSYVIAFLFLLLISYWFFFLFFSFSSFLFVVLPCPKENKYLGQHSGQTRYALRNAVTVMYEET